MTGMNMYTLTVCRRRTFTDFKRREYYDHLYDIVHSSSSMFGMNKHERDSAFALNRFDLDVHLHPQQTLELFPTRKTVPDHDICGF